MCRIWLVTPSKLRDINAERITGQDYTGGVRRYLLGFHTRRTVARLSHLSRILPVSRCSAMRRAVPHDFEAFGKTHN